MIFPTPPNPLLQEGDFHLILPRLLQEGDIHLIFPRLSQEGDFHGFFPLFPILRSRLVGRGGRGVLFIKYPYYPLLKSFIQLLFSNNTRQESSQALLPNLCLGNIFRSSVLLSIMIMILLYLSLLVLPAQALVYLKSKHHYHILLQLYLYQASLATGKTLRTVRTVFRFCNMS
jgi:hypothetical protein